MNGTRVLANKDERVFAEIKRLCYQGLDSATLRCQVLERLRSVVPFEAYAAFTMDPISGLPTGFVDDQVMIMNEEEAHLVYEHVFFEDHLERFARMVKNRIPVELVSQITGGKLERAQMHREVLMPKGFGHEFRGVLAVGKGELWGALLASRVRGEPDFDGRETEFIRRVVPHLGAGLRAAVLRDQAAARHEPDIDYDGASGVLVLDDRGRVVRRTVAAAHWLQDLETVKLDRARGGVKVDDLPLAVWTVVGALRRALHPQTEGDLHSSPRVCVQGRSGRWIALEASLTEPTPTDSAETVVIIGPAGPSEVLKLRTRAYGLSPREKEILDLVVRGYSNKEISKALHISEYTAEDHLSNIFEKVGVQGRRSLVKRLYLDTVFTPG